MGTASRGVPITLLAAGSTTGSGSTGVNPNFVQHRFDIKGTGTISSGTLILEEADSETYTGVWSQLTSIDLTTITGGAAVDVHYNGILRAVRARLSVNVGGGGSIEVTYTSAAL